MRRIAVFVVLVASLLAGAPAARAASACVSAATGNWTTPGTWTSCAGSFPGAGDSATIQGGHNVTVTGAQSVTSLAMTSATMTFSGATPSLAVSGTTTIDGGTTTGIGTLTLSGATVK